MTYHATGLAAGTPPRLGRPPTTVRKDCDWQLNLLRTTSEPGRFLRELQKRLDLKWDQREGYIQWCPQDRLDEARSAWRVGCFDQFAQEEMGDPHCAELVREWETEIDPLTRLRAQADSQEGEPQEPETSSKMNALYIVGGVVAVGVVGWLVFK